MGTMEKDERKEEKKNVTFEHEEFWPSPSQVADRVQKLEKLTDARGGSRVSDCSFFPARSKQTDTRTVM